MRGVTPLGLSAPCLGWLDRYPALVFLILVLAPVAGHLPSWLLGLSTNPIWTQSAAVMHVKPGLLGGASFGDMNVGWTNQALGRLAAKDWLHFTVPWWNPYSGIGLPLAGEMQPAAFFLPFVLLLAWQGGIVWLEIVLQIFAGLATYALLRRLALGRLAALTGGLLYAFSGTFSWVLGETILNVMPFLPVLLHGIEDARDPVHPHRAFVLTAIGIGGSILAGFPETAYLDGLFALVWAVIRLFQAERPGRFALLIVAGGICGLLVAAPLIVSFVDYGIASDVLATHGVGEGFTPWRGITCFVLPYIFGPLGIWLGSGNLYSISNACGGFAGPLLLLFAIAGLLSRRERPIALMLALWVVVSIGRVFGVHEVMIVTGLIPFMKEIEFWRYSSPTWELGLIVLAAFAIEDAGHGTMRRAVPFLVTAAIVGVCAWLASPWASLWHWDGKTLAYLTIWFASVVGAAVIGIALIALIWYRLDGETRRHAMAAVLVLYGIALCVLPQFSGSRPGKVDWPAIGFLKSRLHLQRFYTLWPILPNYSAYFGIPGLNHNYVPIDAAWSTYIHRNLAPEVDPLSGNIFAGVFPPFDGEAARRDFIRYYRNYTDLGVRYLVAGSGTILSPGISYPPNGPGANAVALYQGHTITMHGVVPAEITRLPGVSEIGIYQGTYGHATDGTASITFCAGGACAAGKAGFAHAPDNGPLTVTFDRKFILHPGERYTLAITHLDGTHADAVWMFPTRDPAVSAIGPDGKPMPGRTMRVFFANPLPKGLLTQVYTDPAMTIWQVDKAAKFYTASAGCGIASPKLASVTVGCSGPGRLIRRELFMDGWRATDNGQNVKIARDHEVLQSVPLRPGVNRLHFAFAPLYTLYAWIAFWLGMAALVFAIVRGLVGRRRNHISVTCRIGNDFDRRSVP